MTETMRRALRTAIQLAAALAGAIPTVAAALDLSAADVAKAGGIVAAFGVIATAIYNALEDRGVAMPLPRSTRPAPPADPRYPA